MKKILITEDDPLMADIYSSCFERDGFQVEVARDGATAVQRLKQNPPDLMLLDLMLPQLNGVEVLKHVRSTEATRHIPVIVLSNSFATSMGEQAAQAGATRLFPKNAFTPRRLIEEVKSVLNAAPTAPSQTNGSALSPVAKSVADLRADAVAALPGRIAELRRLLHSLNKTDNAVRADLLLSLYRTVHQIAGSVSFAGFDDMAKLACALETMLKELHAKPEKLSPSAQRTIAQAVDVLGNLSQSPKLNEEVSTSPLILVVDDDPISREITASALEQAHLRGLNVDDPQLVLKLGQENRFDLIFMDVQMPGMDGFEVCKKLHADGYNANTPVVFVTSMNDFDTRTRSALSGGVDFIGKPILLIELAVKALTHLLIPRKALAA